MTGSYLRRVQNAPLSQSMLPRRIKIAAINRRLAAMEPQQVYAETSHMFIKTFADVVLDYYQNVEVIVLRRQLDQVLRSCMELGWFSQRNPIWQLWMSVPQPGRASHARRRTVVVLVRRRAPWVDILVAVVTRCACLEMQLESLLDRYRTARFAIAGRCR